MKLEKDRIVRSSFFSILQIITTSLGYIGIYLLIIFTLGKEQLGIWSIITSVPAVMSFLGSGVSGSLVRHVPSYADRNQIIAINKLITNGILFNLLLALVIIIPALIFKMEVLGFMFGITIVPQLYINIYYITLLVFLINFVGSVNLSALDGLQLISLKNKLLICCSLFFCFNAFIFIYLFGLIGLLYAQLMQGLLVFSFSIFALYKIGRINLSLRDIDRKVIRLFYTYGGRLQYISILSMLFDPATRYFLNRYFGLSTVGIYDIVNRVITQIRMLIISAMQVITPFVAKRDKESSFDLIYNKAFRGALMMCSILFGCLITASFSVIYLFKKVEVVDFQILVLYLSSANVINILASPAYFIMMGVGNLKYITISHFMSTTLNIVLFLCLGNLMAASIMVLPTFAATILSSVYVAVSFKKSYIKRSDILKRADLGIYLTSLLFPLICVAISYLHFNLIILITVAVIQSMTLLFLSLKNEYLREVIDIVLKRRPIKAVP
ncbi:MAG TPA: hypothetical protein VK541_00210 [Pedobacter sp.]|uniref:hypothetical protein n=1 Tax=Pedobacter sp. TaxID=1411316 RepID=UPI002D100DB3|nr:hypothetical protein [Pedobacter sp.]HMI00866.1 hypothetical protein [Pedobacter sp.]